MNSLVNKFYSNHSIIYKVLLLLATTFLIVYLFPKSGKFKYKFEKEKPWQFENLYAPFNFAVKKTNAEISNEKQDIEDNSILYFVINNSTTQSAKNQFQIEFKNQFEPQLSKKEFKKLYAEGNLLFNEIYKYGVLNEGYNFSNHRKIAIIDNKIKIKEGIYANLTKESEISGIIHKTLTAKQLNSYIEPFTALFFDIVKPNLTFDKAFSDNALDDEMNAISLLRGSIESGTLIISKGEIIDVQKYQILQSLKSEYESQIWTQTNSYWVLLAYGLLVSLALLMLLLFIRKYRLEVFNDNAKVTFIFFNILLMVVITTLVVNYNSKLVYVVPICVLPLVFKAFFDARLGLFAHVITVLILGLIVPNNYEYTFLQIIIGIVTILTVSELYKRANLFISVGQITLIYIVAYFAFFLLHEGSIVNIHWEYFIWFVLSGLIALFVLPLIYIYEKVFGLVSDVSLLELSDTNSDLLKELSNKAPGTFHHSLNVANLAEAAANEIGANAMLVRVGALYHDIGKMKNPTYFTENQYTGFNPHNDIPYVESAKVIINHVIDGIELAKKNKLPDRIIDFIRTHHGTSVVYYFYKKESEQLEANGIEVNTADFSYPGPKPFSKETAILMMCDSVEAASKSLKEINSTKIDQFVESIINKQIEEGQFLNANITFKDIELIKKVIKVKLANMYHLRIEYPE